MPILDDSTIEPTERFAVVASSSTPGAVVDPDEAVVDILDNDGWPILPDIILEICHCLRLLHSLDIYIS